MKATRDYKITVLGRTLEHLGVQMYKQRNVAIAELVANCWDANATTVHITIPDESSYDYQNSKIIITDNGTGMDPDEVQTAYLVIGRNRRAIETESESKGGAENEAGSESEPKDIPILSERLPMGRKGIGKLAGFGIAKEMIVETWREDKLTRFTLDIDSLKKTSGNAGDINIKAEILSVSSEEQSSSGTRIILKVLKNVRPIIIQDLHTALGRRFSRTVRGHMDILVNGVKVAEPQIELVEQYPNNGDEFLFDALSDGTQIKYNYGFSAKPIRSPDVRGFAIYVRGKTAQAPPFYFNVEATASGQHTAKYLVGSIEADFLDEGADDESDIISTDRQEIDWEHERVQPLLQWGGELTRRLFVEWANRKGEETEKDVLSNVDLKGRIDDLDETSRKQVRKFLHILGKAEPDPDKVFDLADGIIKAYEYRHFYDVIADIEKVSEDPQELHRFLEHLHQWRVLESRAILEIVDGRLKIIDKFHSLIVDNAPETAGKKGTDNLHDLIGRYPWLINPEWQVFEEEKSITKTLREWNVADEDDNSRERYDFLALTSDSKLVIIEIKRAGHPVSIDELQRLERYGEKLQRANKDIYMVMICGGLNVSARVVESWKQSEDREILDWSTIHGRTKSYYEHYRAVLEGDVGSSNFYNKRVEVQQTRHVLEHTSYRGTDTPRKIGPQDIDYSYSRPQDSE